MRRSWVPAAVLAAVLTTAGCTTGTTSAVPGPDSAPPAVTAASTAPSTGTALSAPVTAPPPAPVPAAAAVPLPAATADATAALRGSHCTADEYGVWSFHGTVHNTTTAARHYTLALAVTSGARVLGHGIATVTVPARSTRPVSAVRFAATPDTAATCDVVVSAEAAA